MVRHSCLIVVTGMPGAGKDEFIQVCVEEGFTDLHMGNAVRKFAAESEIPVSDADIGKFATSEREKFGKDVWARRTLMNVESPLVVIDGLRSTEELDFFIREAEADRSCLVSVFASRKTRLDRIVKRNRMDDVHTLSELIRRDNRELEWGVGKAIALADIMLVNESTLDDFRAEARSTIRNILGRGC